MGALRWLGDHWFETIQSAGIIVGLVFTAHAIKREEKARRISNLLAVTARHHDLWGALSARPGLGRVLDATADLEHVPVRRHEELFTRSLILHLYSVHCAIRNGVYPEPERLATDIASFFALPIPTAVWEKVRSLQDEEFVRFVEECLAAGPND